MREIVFDTETTGLSPGAGDRMVEIGCIEMIGRVETGRHFHCYFNPERTMPSEAEAVHGLSDIFLSDKPLFVDKVEELLEFIGDAPLVAHNASFDRGFLRSEFQRAGVAFHPDVLCTVKLSRALWPHEKRHGLDALIERHALEPMARHRALADADLLWQFWRRLHALWPLDVLRAHVDRTMRRYRIAGDITEDMLDTAPAGHGVYAFFDASDTPLYVGRSVRLRQRVRAHLAGDRRSAREIRIAEQVRRVQWRATGGELGALLTEAQWVSALRPVHNRQPRFTTPESVGAPWPFDMAAVFEEQGDEGQPGTFHVVHRWCYLGAAASMEAARALAAGYGEPVLSRLRSVFFRGILRADCG